MDKFVIFAGAFGFSQLSMVDVDLLHKNGNLKKKKKNLTPTEQDGVAIYFWLTDRLQHLNGNEISKKAAVMDKMVKKLFNENKIVNNYLLSLYILREWLDEMGGKLEQGVILPKIERIIKEMDVEIREGRFDPDLKKYTSRVAKNIYRQWSGRAQLSDEVFDANTKRFTRGKK